MTEQTLLQPSNAESISCLVASTWGVKIVDVKLKFYLLSKYLNN